MKVPVLPKTVYKMIAIPKQIPIIFFCYFVLFHFWTRKLSHSLFGKINKTKDRKARLENSGNEKQCADYGINTRYYNRTIKPQ